MGCKRENSCEKAAEFSRLCCLAKTSVQAAITMDNVTADFLASNQSTIRLAIALLLGAIVGLERGWDARELSAWAFPVLLIAVIATALVAYSSRLQYIRNFSITGIIGMVLTFCFGAIAVAIDPVIATAAAVVPAISFVGYFAVRLAGTQKGILFTSLFAGLSSSTALTLHFARQSAKAPALLPSLVLPVLVMTALLYGPALIIWYRHSHNSNVSQPVLNQNPLDLSSALIFGALLTGILLLGEFLKNWLGDTGIYVLAARPDCW